MANAMDMAFELIQKMAEAIAANTMPGFHTGKVFACFRLVLDMMAISSMERWKEKACTLRSMETCTLAK